MDDLTPRVEVAKKMAISVDTLDRLRQKCEVSPYSDATITVGRQVYFYWHRWNQFLRWESAKERKEKIGF